MSIEQTKLFKESIETPILKTNEVKAQVVEASQVASNDIWVLGYNLENVLFGDDVIEQIVDSTELLKSKHGVEPTYGAEQIIAFQMKVPQEYKGKYISSVTLRRRDTNTGNEQPIAQREQVYLYANCMTSYKELGNNNNINENDFIVDTFYSIDKHRQTVDDGLQTTWNFDEPIKIKRNYNYIRFYCTRVRGEAQTNINLRSSNVKFNNIQGGNKKGLLDGWITIDQAGPVGFTTEFTINLLSKELGFITHIQNTSIHLDEQKNNLLNSISDISNNLTTHANNENVHITTDQKEKLKTLHILQTSYNIHKNNKTIHITEDERNKWNQKFGLNQIIDFLDVPATKVFSTLKQGFVNNSGGKCDAICIQLSQPHFTTGKIFEVQIPYTGGKDKTSYLCAQIFTKDENENTKKTLKDCIFSENTQTQPSSSPDNPKVCYQFNNLVLPQDYKFVRFIFTEDNKRLPDISTEENCVAMRVKIITQQSNATGWDDWDDDECILYIDRNTTKNWYGYVNAVQPEKIYGVTQQEKDNWNDHVGNNDIHVTTNDKTNISRVPSLETNINNHIADNDIHVTENDKTNISKVSSLETDINTHVGDDDIHVTAVEKEKWNSIEIPQPITYTSGDNISINSDNAISVVTTNVISNSNKIPTTKAIYDDFYNEKSFDNFDSTKYTYLPDTVGTIVLSKKHFISGGRITKVTVPHGNTQNDLNNGQGGFLVIDVFTEDNQHDEGYNIHSPRYRYCADEYYAYKNRLNEKHYEWTFNNTNCIIPDDYKVVHLSLVVDDANVSKVGVGSTTNAKFRINCLAKNGDRDEGVVFEEDDECRLYWNGNTNGANRIGIVNVDYVEHKFDTIGDKLENHISSDVHLSSSDKTKIGKIDSIQSSITQHVGDTSHLSNQQKIEIGKITVIENDVNDIKQNLQDQIITYSEQSEIDFITGATNYQDCQGIAYVQICGNHKLPQNSILTKIRVISPQFRPSNEQFTVDEFHLVIYGDVGNDNYQFIDCSTNKHQQIPYGDDMIFQFEGQKDLGQYEKYRLFYARNKQDANSFPEVTNDSANYTGVKMAFRAYEVDLNCAIWQTNNATIYNRSFPAFFNIVNKFSQVVNHIDNTQKHFTAKEKNLLYNSIQSIDEKMIEVNTHMNTYDIHLDEEQRRIINKFEPLKTTVEGHIGDGTHLNSDNKAQIAKVPDLITKYNNITTILNNSLPDIETFSTLDSGNYVIKTGGKSNATGVQLSREHFTTGSIKVVEICHIDGINASDIRLCAIVFNHGEDENTPKTLNDCIFSVNTQTQTSGVGGSMCFKFNNLELSDDYEFVRFLFAKGDTVIPVHNDSNTVIEARVQVLAPKEQGSGGEYAESPDDECKVMHISGTSNWYPHVRVMKTVLGYSDIVSLLNRISALESRVSELENS